MIREIKHHLVDGDIERNQLRIESVDEPGPGGGHHTYVITDPKRDQYGRARACIIQFQNGPILENGINGLTNESLLAMVIDRLECFQSGSLNCIENQGALEKVREGLEILKMRTQRRIERGVEGRNEK